MKRTYQFPFLTSLVAIILSALCFVSCEKEDSKAPQITVINDGPVDVTGGAVVKTAGASLRIGDNEIATWTDDRTAAEMCKVTIAFDGKAISEGTTLDKAGKLTLSVADEVGNMSSSSVTTWIDSNAPQITLASEEVNVFGGLELTSAGGALFIGEHEIARWSDDKTSADQCTITATLDGEAISLGTVLDKAGVLKFVITDGAGNASGEKTVTLTDNALYGIDALAGVSFTVDHEYDLTKTISTVNGFSISKIEIILDGNKTTIPDPAHFSSDRWGDASFIITISREDGKSEEFVVDDMKINPLEFSSYTIDKADIVYFWGRWSNSDMYGSTYDFTRTGVFDTQSIVLEAIANGTTRQDAASIQNQLKKNTLVVMEEEAELDREESAYYEVVYSSSSYEAQSESFSDVHATSMVGEMLLIAEPILKKLNKKIIGPIGFMPMGYGKSILIDYLPFVQEHKEMNFFMSRSLDPIVNPEPFHGSYSFLLEGDGISSEEEEKRAKSFVKQENVFFVSNSAGNPRIICGIPDPGVVIKFSDHLRGLEGHINTMWEFLGINAIMGSDYKGVTHGIRYADELNDPHVPGGSMIMKAEYGDNANVWSSSSKSGYWPLGSSEPTSPASSSFMGKAYLSTCANMLANPNITQEENHALLRDVALDGTVLLQGEYYYTTKQMNPGGTLYQFYSKLPETISLSASKLIPIEHSLHINSVIVGPGIVDENGTEVTWENYSQMLGKKLFIDPVKLYKYGHKAGDSIEYTEHLCCDSKGSGAHDNASEAYKSIVSKTFTVKIQ